MSEKFDPPEYDQTQAPTRLERILLDSKDAQELAKRMLDATEEAEKNAKLYSREAVSGDLFKAREKYKLFDELANLFSEKYAISVRREDVGNLKKFFKKEP